MQVALEAHLLNLLESSCLLGLHDRSGVVTGTDIALAASIKQAGSTDPSDDLPMRIQNTATVKLTSVYEEEEEEKKEEEDNVHSRRLHRVMTSELVEAVFESDEMDDDARRSTINIKQTLIALIKEEHAENNAEVVDLEGLCTGLLVPGPPEEKAVTGLYINPVEFAAAFFEVQQDYSTQPPPFTPTALAMAQKEIEGRIVGMLSASVECAQRRAAVGGEGLPMPAGCDSDDDVMSHLVDVLGSEASAVCTDSESLLAALDRAYARHTEGFTLVSQPAIMQPKDIQLARRIRGEQS